MTAFSIQSSLLLTALAALSFAGGVNGQQQYAFLVSNIRNNEDWCVTATNGVSNGRNLGFRRCDFNGSPSNQLWRLDSGIFRSAVDDGQCMTVNFGSALFDGVRVRTAQCDSSSRNQQFSHDGTTDEIRLASNNNYCMANRGDSPNSSDTIHMLTPCGNDGRFKFTYRLNDGTSVGTPATPSPTPVVAPAPPTNIAAGDFSYVNTDGGCFTVRDNNARNDQKLVLGSCNTANQRWNLGETDQLLRTQLDSTKCVQAGRTANPRRGTKMRIFPCDSSNPLQLFTTTGTNGNDSSFKLQLAAYPDFCVDHRGVSANINNDPILAKPCNEAGQLTITA